MRLLPAVWLVLACLGSYFKGGEYITFGITWLPGMILAVPLKLAVGQTFGQVAPLLLLGLVPVAGVGFLLDFFRLPMSRFMGCCLVGVAAAFLLRAYFFVSDIRLTSFDSAFHRLDLDQWDRAVALALLVIAFGFYLAILFAFGAVLRRRGGVVTE